MKDCLIKLVIMMMLVSTTVTAQTGMIDIDTSYSSNFLQTTLYNDINLANLNSILNYTTTFGKAGFNVENYYLSNVSKLERNFFRDYNNFRILGFYNVNEKLSTGLGFQSKFFTDDKSVATNKNNSEYFYANVDYRLNENMFLNSKAGLKFEDQIGEKNTGFSGVMDLRANNYAFNEYLANGKLVLFYENLIAKQNHNYEINAKLYKRFSNEADNTGSAIVYNQRNDIYSPATPSVASQYNVRNNIEKRTENFFHVNDRLNYSFSNNLLFTLTGFFTNRNIVKEFKYKPSSASILFENVYDTRVLQNDLEFTGALNFNWYKFLTQLKIGYFERSENHTLINTAGLTPSQITELERAEKNKNNNSRRTSLLFDTQFFYSNTNAFGFIGSASMLRYDTDFDQNFDDRDELETILSAYHSYNNLLNFKILTRFDIILSDLSYIYSQRSANNYRNRIYKLTSETVFNPVEKLTSKNYVQVLANYTVYDFEDIISQVQSFSYRQLYIRDSTTYTFYRNLNLEFMGELKLYEQGQFNSDNFSVKPIAYFVEQFYLPELSINVNYFLKVAAGYRYFRQERFLYENGSKNLANTFRTFGPVGKIILYLNKNSIINFTGSLDFIRYDNSLQDDSSFNLQLNVLWNM